MESGFLISGLFAVIQNDPRSDIHLTYIGPRSSGTAGACRRAPTTSVTGLSAAAKRPHQEGASGPGASQGGSRRRRAETAGAGGGSGRGEASTLPGRQVRVQRWGPAAGGGGRQHQRDIREFLREPGGELLDRRSLRTRAQTRMAVFEYIESFYNPRRPHSALGYLSPIS